VLGTSKEQGGVADESYKRYSESKTLSITSWFLPLTPVASAYNFGIECMQREFGTSLQFISEANTLDASSLSSTSLTRGGGHTLPSTKWLW